jgi:hypothetical protein
MRILKDQIKPVLLSFSSVWHVGRWPCYVLSFLLVAALAKIRVLFTKVVALSCLAHTSLTTTLWVMFIRLYRLQGCNPELLFLLVICNLKFFIVSFPVSYTRSHGLF